MTTNAEPIESIRAVLAPDGRSRSSRQPGTPTLATSPAARRGARSGAVYRATWGRAFALVYDTAFGLAERRGLRTVRQDLVGQAKGRVVELGAGTGLNLDHYTESVTELHLTEPEPHMATRLRKRVDTLSLDANVVGAHAEDLPFDDHSVDTVVSTLVLCTVSNPHQAMAEIARVLRPGGVVLFAEHVRSDSPRGARWQDRLNRPWGWYACGCHCNRDTIATLREASFQIGDITRDRLRWISPLVRPLAVGTASPSGAADASVVHLG
jgi:ubiquinone/menaquinone biosynthesis C-methylase UbiE